MPAPTVSYLICANQRSGSTLLCRALSDTGVAGHPDEYFLTGPPEAFPPGWTFWEEGPLAQAHGVTDREQYLELVYDVGSTANGVFGAKLMRNNVEWVMRKFHEMPRFAGRPRADVFHEVFPNLHVVHLVRRDRVRQAVSWARAEQDGVWVVSEHEPAVPSAAPAYDAGFIAGLERLIVDGEREWWSLYDELGVTPYEVVYEDLVTDAGYEHAVRGVLDDLGVSGEGVAVPRPRTLQQADAINDEWVARYRSERHHA